MFAANAISLNVPAVAVNQNWMAFSLSKDDKQWHVVLENKFSLALTRVY